MGKIRNYDEWRVFFSRKKRFHLFKTPLYKNVKAKNMQLVAGRLVYFRPEDKWLVAVLFQHNWTRSFNFLYKFLSFVFFFQKTAKTNEKLSYTEACLPIVFNGNVQSFAHLRKKLKVICNAKTSDNRRRRTLCSSEKIK